MRSKLLLTVMVPIALLAGCNDPSEGQQRETRRLEGVIVELDARLLGEVRGFTLQREGRTYEIRVTDETRAPFPLDHLHQHMASADPVTVEVEERGGRLYARSIADA